jgi:hypothetical protein
MAVAERNTVSHRSNAVRVVARRSPGQIHSVATKQSVTNGDQEKQRYATAQQSQQTACHPAPLDWLQHRDFHHRGTEAQRSSPHTATRDAPIKPFSAPLRLCGEKSWLPATQSGPSERQLLPLASPETLTGRLFPLPLTLRGKILRAVSPPLRTSLTFRNRNRHTSTARITHSNARSTP